MTIDEVCAEIRALHRQCRFAMKSQSRIGRSLEAFIRVNVFGFNPFGEEKELERISKETMALLKKMRSGKCPDEYKSILPLVEASDTAQAPWDRVRLDCEKRMRKLVVTFPGYALVESTSGFGELGFAQIIGETGNISNYATVSKLWKRLGFAPYQGFAPSSWRTNRAGDAKLNGEQWTEVGYNPERYSISFTLGDSMLRHQIESAGKSETEFGRPKGPYGEIYVARRMHTLQTHPDWSKAHAQADAQRIMFKRLLRDLWVMWHRQASTTTTPVFELPAEQIPSAA